MLNNVCRREILRNRYNRIVREQGEDSPAARAIKGRLFYYIGQQAEGDIETISFYRVSTVPGFLNRSQRKHV